MLRRRLRREDHPKLIALASLAVVIFLYACFQFTVGRGTVAHAPTPSPTPYPQIAPLWRIAFQRAREDRPDAVTDIWVARADGSDVHRLIEDAEQPAWSPDRRRLAFARRGNVWIASADGTGQRQLTFWPDAPPNGTVYVAGISWNATDDYLSFGRAEQMGVRTAGADREALLGTTTVYHVTLKTLPNWQPTNPSIPFLRPRDVTPTALPDRKFAPQFDVNEGYTSFHFTDNRFPAWSPSGTRFIVVRNGDLWLAESEFDGAPLLGWTGARVVASAVYDGWTGGASHWVVAPTSVSWSPDESFFVYTNCRITGSGQDNLNVVWRRTYTNENGYPTIVYENARLEQPASHVSVSPDGKWLLLTYEGSVTAVTPEGKNPRPILRNAQHAVW
jgi:hypothetical protein